MGVFSGSLPAARAHSRGRFPPSLKHDSSPGRLYCTYVFFLMYTRPPLHDGAQ